MGLPLFHIKLVFALGWCRLRTFQIGERLNSNKLLLVYASALFTIGIDFGYRSAHPYDTMKHHTPKRGMISRSDGTRTSIKEDYSFIGTRG